MAVMTAEVSRALAAFASSLGLGRDAARQLVVEFGDVQTVGELPEWLTELDESGSLSAKRSTQETQDHVLVDGVCVTCQPRTMMRKFNPAEPRDPHSGKWVDTTPGDEVVHAVEDFARALTKAANKQDALDATPAKLKRPPGGHHGDYTGEGLTGPKGMGSVRALSEYEGVEYQTTNLYLRGGYRLTDEEKVNLPDFLEGVPERIAEIDKTMKVSRLAKDVRVDRAVKHGDRVFGREVWYGDVVDWDEQDFDVQDEQIAVWESGVRPDLTGLRWKELGYSSTTADPAVAKDFGKRWPGSMSALEGEPIIMTILVPKGTGGVQLAEMGHAAEILLERNLTFEVVRDNGVVDQFRRLDVRVVPDGE